MTGPKCHYDAELGWVTPEHVRDCDDHGCAGCKPCGKTHCAMRGRCSEHVEAAAGIRTCPRCIGKVRTRLTRIENLYALADVAVELRANDSGALLDEAAESGIDGEAFNLVGPAADPAQWAERRRRVVAADRARGWCDYPRHGALDPDDERHPYAVLGRWDYALREEYGPQTDLFITVSRAADYLRGLLDGPFPHGDEFEDFDRETTACLTHLEAVIHDSRAPEEGRHCPVCIEQFGKGPRLRKRYADHDTTGASDTWHCLDNSAHWWTESDYRSRVASDYLEYAVALTAADMQAQYRIKPGSLRTWAARGLVRKRGKNDQGLTLYDVADARSCKRVDEPVA
jgi:hypothetical protein